jgi:leucyl aminopeptidase
MPEFADPSEEAISVWPVTSDASEDWTGTLSKAQQAWIEAQGFSGRRGEVVMVPDAEGQIAGVAFGLGSGGAEGRIFGDLAFAVPEGVYSIAPVEGVEIDLERAALGWLLGSYAFDEYKLEPKRDAAALIAPKGIDAGRVARMAKGMCLARNLINTPAQDMGPAALEGAVRVLANAHSAAIETIEGEALLEQNYPMIHTVGRAAAQAPRLIDMRWAGPDAKTTITLVGKGVCFDTGGLDIKPSSSMLLMKKDMGGAASVLGLASMIMDAGLPVTLRVLIPAVENSVSASSFRPGDVLTARNGITVENRNTDAEGRLVLGDALVEAASEDPDLIIDMATLTGAARVALGPDLPPLFTDGDTLAAEIMDAGLAVDDPVWRLPLWNGYDPDIGSRVAEITNAPSGGMAGSITAALFLRRFVTDPQKWAHFDIYGWAPSAKPGRPQGGECQAALACYKMIEDRCA